ncbi:MAG: mechanosensitive ion channel family protein [Burkholderiales bacterium]|nr:mechanosensitive ion channel family protein [Burkholderiales bacterium]
MNNLGSALASATAGIVERIVTFLPSLLGALLLVLVGWLLARILRALTVRALLLVESLASRLSSTPGAEPLRMRRAATVLGAIAFWAALLVFVTAATHVLELTSFTDWLARLVGYLPTLAAGVLIVIAGYVLSRFVADLVLASSHRLETTQRALLARVVQVTILTGAILVGADQIGIRITFLAIFAASIGAVVAGGVALAVGLGARDYVANLIGAHYLRQAFAIGQTIRAGAYEGRILEITALGLIIETADGRLTLPGRIYNEQPIAVLGRTAGHGDITAGRGDITAGRNETTGHG